MFIFIFSIGIIKLDKNVIMGNGIGQLIRLDTAMFYKTLNKSKYKCNVFQRLFNVLEIKAGHDGMTITLVNIIKKTDDFIVRFILTLLRKTIR